MATLITPPPSSLVVCFYFQTYLEKLGSIKHDMRYAGSTDLSFATWLCGGGAYVVPCSRVAKVQSASTSMVGILSVKYFYILMS